MLDSTHYDFEQELLQRTAEVGAIQAINEVGDEHEFMMILERFARTGRKVHWTGAPKFFWRWEGGSACDHKETMARLFDRGRIKVDGRGYLELAAA
jgi:hypothetical protein